MAEETEARVKLVADDGGAAESMRKLAEATKRAAAAEDDLQKKLKQRAAIVRDLVRMDAMRPGGIIDRSGGGGMGGSSIGQGSLALQHDAARRATRGGGMGGGFGGGGFGGGGINGAINGLGARFGLSPSAMTYGGGALAAVGVVQQGLAAYQEQRRIESDAYLTPSQKAERIARSRPFGVGRAYGAALDFYRDVSGQTALKNRYDRVHAEELAKLPLVAAQNRARFTSGFAESAAGSDARAMSGLSLARPAGFDRGSVIGEKLYQEEAKLLPLVHQRQVAARKAVAAEDKALKAAAEEAKIRDEIKRHDENIEILRGKRAQKDTADTRADAHGFARAEDLEHERRKEAQARLEAAMGRTAELNKGAAAARGEVRQADVAIQQARAEQLSSRELTARGQAERFGLMGVEGRVRGRFALQRLQAIGIDRADQETIAAASAYAPETVRKLAGRSGGAGERELSVGRRLTGDSGEFRDTNLEQISRQAAEARDRAIGSQEADVKSLASELEQSVRGLAPALVAAIQRGIDQVAKDLEAKAYVRNNGNP